MRLTCVRTVDAAAIGRHRSDYLATLAAPLDGMWESTAIAQARFWDISDDGRHAGHCCIDADNVLLRFHPAEPYRAQAETIFRWLIATRGIRRAIASTIESRYFALVLDRQEQIAPHSYLFRDHRRVTVPPEAHTHTFKKAELRELGALTRFYRANTAGAGAWIEAFLHDRLAADELFGLYDGHRLIAAGECIPSRRQPPYADLGIVVAQAVRGRGLGRGMLVHLKHHCYAAGWQPICSCAADNRASKRAIEHAGFISEQRMVTILFAEEVASSLPANRRN